MSYIFCHSDTEIGILATSKLTLLYSLPYKAPVREYISIAEEKSKAVLTLMHILVYECSIDAITVLRR